MPNRYAHVDSLRAIAALVVLWMHTSEVFVGVNGGVRLGGTRLFEIAATVDFGRIGVVLFFFISGFVIPNSLTGERGAGTVTFIVRRFFRLYPAYWLSIPLALITTWWAFGRPIIGWQVAANLTMVQELFGAPDIEGLYWTLRIELIFYGLCLALFLLRVLRVEAVLAAVAGAMLLVFVAGIVKNFFIPSLPMPALLNLWGGHFAHLSIMFTGALWRRLYDGQAGRSGKLFLGASTLWWLVLFPAVALYLFLQNGTLHPDHKRLFFSYPLATLLFVAGILYVRINWRPMAWLGEISYSLYLFHPVVLYALLWVAFRFPKGHWMRTQYVGVYILAVAVGTVALSALVYHWLEKPMIRLGRRLTERRAAPAPGRLAAEAAR